MKKSHVEVFNTNKEGSEETSPEYFRIFINHKELLKGEARVIYVCDWDSIYSEDSKFFEEKINYESRFD